VFVFFGGVESVGGEARGLPPCCHDDTRDGNPARGQGPRRTRARRRKENKEVREEGEYEVNIKGEEYKIKLAQYANTFRELLLLLSLGRFEDLE
jgi:hypothetical protein